MGYLIANLAVFYKGAVSIRELESMPIPKILELNQYAERINQEVERKLKGNRHGL